MKYLLLTGFILVMTGCSDEPKPLAMATTAELARPALEAALNAWKAGKTQAELKAQTPPMYFNDVDFSRGRKLADFKIEGVGEPYGTGYRFHVLLTIDESGKPAAMKVPYRVVTNPATSIYREDS